MNDLTNVTTGEVRLSYVHLFKPYAFQPGQEEKFSCTILIPKSDTETMARINNAIAAATEKGVSDKWNGVRPPVIPNPVYDGDGVRPSDGMAFGPECENREELTFGDPRTEAWLRGEEIEAVTAKNGWCAVLVNGLPLGGGKVSGGRVKNHYPKALRNLK